MEHWAKIFKSLGITFKLNSVQLPTKGCIHSSVGVFHEESQ